MSLLEELTGKLKEHYNADVVQILIEKGDTLIDATSGRETKKYIALTSVLGQYGKLTDIAMADDLEVRVGHKHDKLWVNLNGVCIVRVQGIKNLRIEDDRKYVETGSSNIPLE